MSPAIAERTRHIEKFRELARAGNADALREMLTDTAIIEALRLDAAEAVAVAAEWGRLATLQTLIAHGFPVDEYTETGKYSPAGTPLFRTCEGHVPEEVALPVIEFLLERGANPNTRLRDSFLKGRLRNETPLHLAARIGYPQVAERLVQAGANVFATTHGDKNQPLHEALFGGVKDGFTDAKERVASLLIRHGAKVDAPHSDGETPLCRACIGAHAKVALFLLRNGANVNAGSRYRPNVLHEVMMYFYRWARAENWVETEQFPADVSGMQVLSPILDAGVDVNAADSQGKTPLHYAAWHTSYQEAARLFVRRGANLNAIDASGKTPFAVATPSSDLDFLAELLAAGASPLAGAKGCSALEYVVHYGGEEKLKVMLAALAPMALSAWSETLLHAAVQYDAADCVSLLVPFGVNPAMAFTPGRMSPLHTAARRDSVKLLELCLQAGSDPNITDRLGRPPLYLAARQNRADAITILLRHGANASIAAKDGKTPLAIAQEKNKKRAIAVL